MENNNLQEILSDPTKKVSDLTEVFEKNPNGSKAVLGVGVLAIAGAAIKVVREIIKGMDKSGK